MLYYVYKIVQDRYSATYFLSKQPQSNKYRLINATVRLDFF